MSQWSVVTRSHQNQVLNPVLLKLFPWVCKQEPIPVETDEMTTLEKLTKLSKDYLASNLNGDSLSSENSSDDEGE